MPPVVVALGAERCVAHNLEVFVAHPERCEDRPPVEREGEVWVRLLKSGPPQWILLLKLTSNQDATALFVLPRPARIHKLHERVYKAACILPRCRKTTLHAWWRPGMLVAKVVRAGIGHRRRRYVWV